MFLVLQLLWWFLLHLYFVHFLILAVALFNDFCVCWLVVLCVLMIFMLSVSFFVCIMFSLVVFVSLVVFHSSFSVFAICWSFLVSLCLLLNFYWLRQFSCFLFFSFFFFNKIWLCIWVIFRIWVFIEVNFTVFRLSGTYALYISTKNIVIFSNFVESFPISRPSFWPLKEIEIFLVK